MTKPALEEHFFRHEYGRLVAVLSRRVGVQHIAEVEDAVQSALMSAVQLWRGGGLPDNPSAWLFRAANNELLGELRTGGRRRRLLGREEAPAASEYRRTAASPPETFLESELNDDLLQMLFVCCDDSIPLESQLVLALKTLCGFSIREIAQRLFSTEANVYKRLSRARSQLRKSPLLGASALELDAERMRARLSAVHKVLYLLFTEGYLSSDADTAIRRDLCHEAIRLTTILAQHQACETPETCALLALMHLHAARMTSRQDSSGGLLLLEEQNRELWDAAAIGKGLGWLSRSAQGRGVSRYHAEAAIAAEHCLAPTFRETRWDKVVEYYALLERIEPTAVHRLNRAVAVAECQGAAAGLEVLAGFVPPTWLAGSYQWAAVLADLHRRAGNTETAERYRDVAAKLAPSAAVRELLARRLRGR